MQLVKKMRGLVQNRERIKNATLEPDKVKLNLGCGDKILPGYINVDAAPSRKGAVPDVISDIRKLDFTPGSADEILSVHVIEHFYYWEAQDLLKHWFDVLKPGGKIVVECPNIAYAAKMLAKAPRKYSASGKEGQLTMWAFYGDPSWKDPLMCHKWGYVPQSLVDLLRSVGFIDVKQKPAQFKKREPRDMRVEGVKPL